METKEKPGKMHPVLPDANPRYTFVARITWELCNAARQIAPANINTAGAARVAAYLIRQAKTHNRLAVADCNGELPEGDKRASQCEARIRTVLRDLPGRWDAVFGGDPRGCTVKLKVPSGYTDDWGHEGLCVPT